MDNLLALIERRTSYMRAQIRWAIAQLLAADADPEPGYSAEDLSSEPTLRDLEQYAPYWAHLVPDDATARATVARLLSEKYGLARQAVPRIRRALQLDTPAVAAEYRRLFGDPPAWMTGTWADNRLPSPPDGEERGLDGALWRDLEADLEWVSLEKGAVLLRQGDPSDSLYVVINGRLRTVAVDQEGAEQFISEVGRGESVGEMGVITGDPRSATLYAIRDSELARLSARAFDRLVDRYPAMSRYLTRLLVTRLRAAMHARRSRPTVRTFALIPLDREAPVSALARRLAGALAALGPTLHLNGEILERSLGPGALQQLEDDRDAGRIVGWLNSQEIRHRFVLYEADPAPSAWTRRCLRQADRVLLVGRAGADPAPGEIERDLARAEAGTAPALRDLILLHPDRAARPRGTHRWLAARQIHAHHHLAMDSEEDLHRLARRLAGRAVGVVLSGGGARAFAHIGALQALREAGIPIDLIGGSSAGSIVAAHYAMGWEPRRIVAAGKELLRSAGVIKDFTVPVVSLLAARKFTSLLATLFGDTRIEDLRLDYFCVSSNLSRAAMAVHREGSLARYVRASCALPGLLPPVLEHGELLVDATVLNNLPVDVMEQQCDGGEIIAVDVSIQFALQGSYAFGDSVSAGQLLLNRLNPFARPKIVVPNIVAILMRAAELSSVRERLSQVDRASLYINPPVERYGTLDLKSLDAIVDVGYRAARAQIEAWRRARS